MAAHEWIVVAYFSGLMLAAWLMPGLPERRGQATVMAITLVMMVLAVAITDARALRAWIPIIYLLAGYWMPALLVTPSPGEKFELWLIRSDTTFRRWLPSVPGSVVSLVELAYLFCYPLVPLSFTVVWVLGGARDVERFWVAVLLSGYSCYVTLPWLISRPPRTLRRSAATGIRRVNANVLEGWSHRFNTFPSGHVAVSVSAAAIAGSVSTPAGLAIGTVAAAIAVGAAAGGYHYVIDVLLGLIVAAMAVIVAGAV